MPNYAVIAAHANRRPLRVASIAEPGFRRLGDREGLRVNRGHEVDDVVLGLNPHVKAIVAPTEFSAFILAVEYTFRTVVDAECEAARHGCGWNPEMFVQEIGVDDGKESAAPFDLAIVLDRTMDDLMDTVILGHCVRTYL